MNKGVFLLVLLLTVGGALMVISHELDIVMEGFAAAKDKEVPFKVPYRDPKDWTELTSATSMTGYKEDVAVQEIPSITLDVDGYRVKFDKDMITVGDDDVYKNPSAKKIYDVMLDFAGRYQKTECDK